MAESPRYKDDDLNWKWGDSGKTAKIAAVNWCSENGYYNTEIVDHGNWRFSARCSDTVPEGRSRRFTDELAREYGYHNRDHAGDEDCKKRGYAGRGTDWNWSGFFDVSWDCKKYNLTDDDKDACCAENVIGTNKIVNGKLCEGQFMNADKEHCNNYFNNYCKVGDKIIKDAKCKGLSTKNSTLYNQLMKTYCNSSDAAAKTDECGTWCETNRTDCTRKNLLDGCAKSGIAETGCTQDAYTKLRNQCEKYQMVSALGTGTGWACTPNGLAEFESECAKYGISLDSCAPPLLESAKLKEEQRRLAFEVAQEQQEKNNERYQKTLSVIKQLEQKSEADWAGLGLEDKPETSSDNTLLYIIIVLAIILLIIGGVLFRSLLSTKGVRVRTR